MFAKKHAPLIVVGALAIGGIVVLVVNQPHAGGPVASTMADLRAMHADVHVGTREILAVAGLASPTATTSRPAPTDARASGSTTAR